MHGPMNVKFVIVIIHQKQYKIQSNIFILISLISKFGHPRCVCQTSCYVRKQSIELRCKCLIRRQIQIQTVMGKMHKKF